MSTTQRRRQQLRKQRYVAAGIITFIIFSLGLTIGFVFENKRIDYLGSQYEENTLSMYSSQVQYDYIQRLLTPDNCELLFEAYHESLEELDETTIRLESYSSSGRMNTNEYDRLKRRHVITQMKYYLLGNDIQQTCDDLELSTVLYFYGTKKDCPDCEAQAFVLDYAKRVFGQHVLIFSFNAQESHERLVHLLRASYNISSYPSVVVNNKVYKELVNRDVLIQELCQDYGNTTTIEICQ